MAFEKMTVEQHPGRGNKPLKLPKLGSFQQERKDDFKKLINWLAIGGGIDTSKYWVYAVEGKPKDGTIPEAWWNSVRNLNSNVYHLALGVEKVDDSKRTPVVTLNRIDDFIDLSELSVKYHIICLIHVQKRR
ncbi:hypothetical protein KBA63_00855 [Candidatus Woesebacteria bacterium]|nr:hypothetical protein [Candidatus Woesebacteria bacterium]MBP9687434.1 hypothetical protein [Candidatus Woesebacteria bacterium]